jgi:hypothetical protein
MIIYLCLIIPIIAICVLAWKFHAKMAWWEYLLVFGVPALCIVATKTTSSFMQKTSTEYWNTYLVSATYYEDWDEWIDKTCYHTCYDQCKDSDGNSYQCNPHDCNPYDCSYREYHPAYWEATDNTGKTIHINQGQFDDLCRLWGKRVYEDLNRHYYRDDGDAFHTSFDGKMEHTVPYTTKHIYENKVKCSKSVFNFAKVDSEDVNAYGLYDYPPADGFGYNPILGWSTPEASKKLQQYNAQLGSVKQVHMMILVFKDKPVMAALCQEGLWKGGNKNEFILCIGTDGKQVTWAKVISWTEVDELKIRVEKTVQAMPFDLNAISDYMAKEVRAKFVRKQFKDFSYLSIEPTQGAIWTAFIITFIATIGLAVFCVKNDIDL